VLKTNLKGYNGPGADITWSTVEVVHILRRFEAEPLELRNSEGLFSRMRAV
jgi:hypothetical protein